MLETMFHANRLFLQKYGSPIYVYREEILEDRCREVKAFEVALQNALGKKVSMHYSTKANSNPTILKIVKRYGLKVDCMSPLELTINLKRGFQPSEILYVCNNISDSEMVEVHSKRIPICLDSVSQVSTWGELYPDTEIMVRINPGITGVGHSKEVITAGKSTKFGISEANFEELFRVAENYGLRIIGTHQHLGSLFLNDKIPEYIAGVKAGLKLIKKYFKGIEIVDLGGGFGVPYKPEEEKLDLNLVRDELKSVLREFISEYPSVKEFKFEPGRYIPCESGVLLGTVTATKYENGIWWIGTDIGMNQLVRPSMYKSYHEITLPESNGETIIANFCGNVCESGDILGEKRKVPKPEVGDPVIVHNAGAYGYSMASNYTGRARPAEVIITTRGSDFCISARETERDIIRKFIW